MVVCNAFRSTIRLATPGMLLDLGGIAKGYAGDEAQRILKQRGITRALVELGGDIVVSGAPPGTKGWKILVPNAGSNSTHKEIYFTHKAISSSGSTEQFVVISGKRYSHVVDPRTGQALTNGTQATIIAKTGLNADPLSTALTVLSKSERQRLIRGYPGTKSYVRTLKLVDVINIRDSILVRAEALDTSHRHPALQEHRHQT